MNALTAQPQHELRNWKSEIRNWLDRLLIHPSMSFPPPGHSRPLVIPAPWLFPPPGHSRESGNPEGRLQRESGGQGPPRIRIRAYQFPVSSFQFLVLCVSASLRLCGKAVWQFLREVSGEHDYARYRARALALGERPLTPQDFYLEKLRRTYSRPNRCC